MLTFDTSHQDEHATIQLFSEGRTELSQAALVHAAHRMAAVDLCGNTTEALEAQADLRDALVLLRRRV